MDARMADKPTIRFVVASRESGDRFFEHTALGRSLRNFDVEIRLFEKNTKGLSSRYNQAIDEARAKPAILAFIHDDVSLLGLFFKDEIARSMERFDIVGVAGNKRRSPSQPAWCYLDTKWTKDEAQYLSGVIASGSSPEKFEINDYGPSRQEVKLLDGLLLIAHSETLISSGLRFDEQFDFHFYDMDFCRQAELSNLKMGTWDISVLHGSVGSLGTDSWIAGYKKYLDKWTG